MSEYITWISCSIIFVAFLYFFFQATKLVRGYKIIGKTNNEDSLLESLDGTKLVEIKDEYIKTMTVETPEGQKTNIPASEFFSEPHVAKSLRVNVRMLDVASGTLVGLGLLGTFLGLTLGINGFDSSNSDNIQSSIQTLLDGMGTAFATSLLGMFLSIVYTMFEKPWRNKLSRNIVTLDEKLDSRYFIDDMSLLEMRQEKMTKSMGDTLSKAISIQSAELKQSLEAQSQLTVSEIRQNTVKIETALRGLLMYNTEDGQSVILANAIREILRENEQQSKALKSFSTDLALELNQGFDEVLSRQMQQRIIPLMESVDATTKAVIEHIDQMALNISSPMTDMLQGVLTDLKSSMQEILIDFKSALSSSANNELEQLARSLGTATKALGDFPKNMENISSTLQVTISEVKNAISEISNTSASANSEAMKQMQEQITFATTSISNAIMEVKEVMSALTHSSQSNIEDMMSKMNGASDRMGEFMSQMMQKVTSSVQESIESITNEMVEKQMNIMAIQEDMIKDIKSSMQTMTSSSQESTTGVINSLNQAQSTMGDFIHDTIGELSTSVKNSMESITNEMVEKQINLMAIQEDMIKDIRSSMQTMTTSSQESTTGVINTLNQAQSTMGDFMQKTMENIAASVRGSMDAISSDISDKQATILEFQESTLKEAKRLIETFNIGLDRLERLNQYVSGTMDMFQKAQGEITGSTSNLRSITGDMKIATEAFHKGQSEYTRSMSDLQKLSQSNIDSVTELLRNSGEISEDYVAQFETIKNGLSAIFSQIQSGLHEYSRTIQTSLQSFLGDYTSSLTKTTDALSNSIQSQSDVADMLLEAVEIMNKRR